MQPVPSGSAVVAAEAFWLSLRYAFSIITWAVLATLLAGGLCWCAGLGARAAWARVGPAPRPRHARDEPPDEVGAEAARGIRELEAWLAAQADAP